MALIVKSRRRRSSASGAASTLGRAPGRRVTLAPGRRHVHPRQGHAVHGAPVLHRRGAERTVDGHAPARLVGESPREGGPIALDDEIDIDRPRVAKQITHEATGRPDRHPHGLAELPREAQQPDDRLPRGIAGLFEPRRHRQGGPRPAGRAAVDHAHDPAALAHQRQRGAGQHEAAHGDLRRVSGEHRQVLPRDGGRVDAAEPPARGARQLRLSHRRARTDQQHGRARPVDCGQPHADARPPPAREDAPVHEPRRAEIGLWVGVTGAGHGR
jgi:hypothetical protein